MFSTLSLLLVIAALVSTGVAIVWAVVRNLREGERYRQRLALRLKRLRLGGALPLFKIDPDEYLHTQPIAEIEKHMRQCEGCNDTELCDHAMENQRLDQIPDCVNRPALDAVSASLQQARAVQVH